MQAITKLAELIGNLETKSEDMFNKDEYMTVGKRGHFLKN